MSLDQTFQKAVFLIRNGPAKEVSNSVKLQFYGLYKQATEGDCHTSQPWAVQVTERAKWEAWNSLKGMSKDQAKQRYVNLVAQDEPDWEQNQTLSCYQV